MKVIPSKPPLKNPFLIAAILGLLTVKDARNTTSINNVKPVTSSPDSFWDRIIDGLKLNTEFDDVEKETIETADCLVDLYLSDFRLLAKSHILIDAKSNNISKDIQEIAKAHTFQRVTPLNQNYEAAVYCIIYSNRNDAAIIRFINPSLFKKGGAHAFVVCLHERARTYFYLGNLPEKFFENPIQEELTVAKLTVKMLDFFLEHKGEDLKVEDPKLYNGIQEEAKKLKAKIETLEKIIDKEIEKEKEKIKQRQKEERLKETVFNKSNLNRMIKERNLVSRLSNIRSRHS